MTKFIVRIDDTCFCLLLLYVSLCFTVLHPSNALEPGRYKRQTTNCVKDAEFRCKNGQCVDSSVHCDGFLDCADGSDETAEECRDVICPRFSFKCSYGACVDGSAKCNGKPDCMDRSDESISLCPYLISQNICKEHEFHCISGECIGDDELCDGRKSCRDGSDETYLLCEQTHCDTNRFFRCDYGACIDKRFKCDGTQQCADGSDESFALCNKSSDGKVKEPTTTPKSTSSKSTPTKITSTTTQPTTPAIRISSQCNVPSSNADSTVTYTCQGKSGTACFAQSNKSVIEYTVANIKCNPNYLPVNETNFQSICLDGRWLPEMGRCYRICDKLNPINVDLKCHRKGTVVSCDGTLVAETKIRPTCAQLHIYRDFVPTYQEIYCQEDGKWDNMLFSCIPECGRPYTNAVTLIKDGVRENYGDSPWHVAIFNQLKVLICGGTIITPYIVLSAAHCFHDRINNRKMDAANYEVVVSKISRNYSIIDNGNQRIYKIREIRFSNKGYIGVSNYFAADIAVLILEEKISITPTVLPACVDWIRLNKYDPPEGSPGKVVGWGMNELGQYSDLLLTANLPFMSHERCLNYVSNDFKPFITFDKFCAGSETGPGVLQGDSGGGLFFREGAFYYIRGIISLKQPTKSPIAAFTDLSDHIEWLLTVRNEVEKEAQRRTSVSR